jgi:phage-related protein
MMEEGLAIAPVAYHTPAFSTDLYYTNETNTRASYYGVSSYPTLKADGIIGMSGGGGASENMYSYYRNYYNQRVNVTSPFTIDLNYECVEGNTCRVNCTVNQVGECNGNDVRVFIALTQCNINVNWQGMQGLHHVCRDMIPTQTGTPFSGPTMNISETFEMNWPKEDCYLTAWVQNYSGGTKEVYQAVRMSTALDLDYDLALKEIDNVVVKNCSGMQHPRLQVKNFGHETVNSFEVRVFDGMRSHSQTWNGTLLQGDTVDMVMDDFLTETTGTLQFFVEMPNGHADEFMADNVSSVAMDEVSMVDGALKLQLKTGPRPENTSFEIKNMDTGEVLYYFTYEQSNHVYKEDLLLPHEACYRFTVYDAAGEGMGGGFFQVKDSNGTVVFKGGNSAGRFTYELATELQCDGFVDVEENSSSAVLEAICVAPNPTTGIVNLDLGKGEWHIQLFDITGRKVMEHQCEGSSSLDLSQQQKGLYLLKAQNGTEEYNTKIVLR